MKDSYREKILYKVDGFRIKDVRKIYVQKFQTGKQKKKSSIPYISTLSSKSINIFVNIFVNLSILLQNRKCFGKISNYKKQKVNEITKKNIDQHKTACTNNES